MLDTAKEISDFRGGSALGEGSDFQDLEVVELGDAVVGVFVQ